MTWRPGGPAGSPRPPSASPARRRRSWTPRWRRSRTGSASPRWSGWSTRRSPGSCPNGPPRTPRKAADGRHFTIDHHQVSFDGTSQITGELDLADALDLDAAVAKAPSCSALGSTESLDVRRSMAAGQIARNQLALDLRRHGDEPTERAEQRATDAAGKRTQAAAGGAARAPLRDRDHRHQRIGLELARVENQRRWSPPTRSAPGAPTPTPQVVVKPVIDLNEHIHVEGYEVPDRLREQAALRDHTCVFPWCTRSARKTDADHVIPYAEGGTTCE